MRYLLGTLKSSLLGHSKLTHYLNWSRGWMSGSYGLILCGAKKFLVTVLMQCCLPDWAYSAGVLGKVCVATSTVGGTGSYGATWVTVVLSGAWTTWETTWEVLPSKDRAPRVFIVYAKVVGCDKAAWLMALTPSYNNNQNLISTLDAYQSLIKAFQIPTGFQDLLI